MRNTYSGTSIKNRKLFQKIVFILALCFFSLQNITAQTDHKPHITTKDSLDGAFDLSNYIIYAHGFIVVPTVITEPALGGIGGAIVPVFLKKRAPVVDENGKKRFINPDITGGIGMYTENKSWMAGAFRSATLVNSRILYRVMAGYGDMNLSFYANNIPNAKDQEFKLNFRSTIF